MLGLLVCGWLWAAGVVAAPVDEVTPIGSIVVNPMANNRRAVILKGKTKTLTSYQGRDGFGRYICGQGFILEDDTGALDVTAAGRQRIEDEAELDARPSRQPRAAVGRPIESASRASRDSRHVRTSY